MATMSHATSYGATTQLGAFPASSRIVNAPSFLLLLKQSESVRAGCPGPTTPMTGTEKGHLNWIKHVL